MKKSIWIVFIIFAISLFATNANAVHNDGQCTACHIPHSGGGGPLLNPATTQVFVNTRITGVSKMCLTCHDTGTSNYHKSGGVFGGDTHPISFVFDSTFAIKEGFKDPATTQSHIGAKSSCTTNSKGVETCIVIDQGSTNTVQQDLLKAANPSDPNSPKNRIECTTCHDVHNKYNIIHLNKTVVKKYMNASIAKLYLCYVCHKSAP